MTLGAYLTWLANDAGLNIWLAMILGAVGTIIAMLVAEFSLWQPMRARRASDTTLIIISIGLSLFIRNGILLFFGGSNKNYDLPVVRAMEFGDLRIAYYRVVVVILAFVAIAGVHLVLRYTKIGKAMRAVADNIDLARVSGINVEKVVLSTWIITGTLVAFAGGMYGLITAARPQMGWFLILPMFASVILGGIGNPYGAIAGAYVIGIAQDVGIYWLPNEYKLAIPLVVMILVLLFKPTGLFRGTL